MSKQILVQIPLLSTEGLLLLVQDCERRIGSHVAGGEVNENYIEGQRQILSAIQEELVKRH